MFAVDTKTNEIFLYDDIGPAWLGMIDATSVIAGLKQMEGKRVLLRINSPGGSVDEGAAIYNAIKRHPGGVDVAIDGLAASIAGYIAMAGEKVTRQRGSDPQDRRHAGRLHLLDGASVCRAIRKGRRRDPEDYG